MFLSRNKKNNEYLYKPKFYYKKTRFKVCVCVGGGGGGGGGVKIIKACSRDTYCAFDVSRKVRMPGVFHRISTLQAFVVI